MKGMSGIGNVVLLPQLLLHRILISQRCYIRAEFTENGKSKSNFVIDPDTNSTHYKNLI